MRLAYLGNFQPGLPANIAPWSTETHVAASLELAGHEVTRVQEGEVRALDVPVLTRGHDLFLWTQTLGLAQTGGTIDERYRMVQCIRDLGVPSAGFHLDRWWGLGREHLIHTEPFFKLDHVFTADGGHDAEFAAAGVNHHWLPPGVFEPECVPGTFTRKFAADVAFVGNWRGGYHPEATHRAALIGWLRRTYRSALALFPRGHQIRGKALADLYASVKVVVGDSCILDGDVGMYVSDRVPETIGRGGFLLHPHVEGVFPDLWRPGEHLDTWTAWDFGMLRDRIDQWLDMPDQRVKAAEAGRAWTLEHHTYTHRVQQLLDIVGASVRV